jgi:alkylation response protein AidB-like acyl-CoA dehydrogenase
LNDLIELDELRESVRRVIDDLEDRQGMIRDPSGLERRDRRFWDTLSGLGWLGLAVPEAQGGLGQPFTALSVLYREFGRSLQSGTFMAAAIGVDVLSTEGATERATALIERCTAGEATAVVVTTGNGTHQVRHTQQGFVLDGTYACVPAAGHATHLLIPVQTPEMSIALIELTHAGVEISERVTWDISQQVFDIALNSVVIGEDNLVLSGDAATTALERAEAHLDLALAWDAVGGAERIFSETLEYMATRKQFNRPIASFQALKHRCADLKTSMEAARALVEASSAAFSNGEGEWRAMAACCRLYAGAVYRNVTEEAVQFHGGIGFTWEQACHLFLKRARLNEVLGGSAETRKDRVAPVLLAAARERTRSLLSHRRNAQ